MTLVPRVDLAYTGESYGSIFNGNVNRIKGYAQVNAQLQLNGPDDKWYVKGFIQNVFDANSVTGLYITDQSSGNYTNIFTLEPRRYGIAAGVKFSGQPAATPTKKPRPLDRRGRGFFCPLSRRPERSPRPAAVRICSGWCRHRCAAGWGSPTRCPTARRPGRSS